MSSDNFATQIPSDVCKCVLFREVNWNIVDCDGFLCIVDTYDTLRLFYFSFIAC